MIILYLLPLNIIIYMISVEAILILVQVWCEMDVKYVKDSGPRFWLLDPLPEYIRVWVFRTTNIGGKGHYMSFQPHPSGVTLRYIIKGEWQVKMCGLEHQAGVGDIFCALPSETIWFGHEDKEADWEWQEIQLNGPCAEKFLKEFDLGRKSPVITPSEPSRALAIFKKMYELMAEDKRSVPEALALLFELVAVCVKGNKEISSYESLENSKKILVAKAKDFFETSPSVKRNVSEIAEILGVDRSTLFRAFKEETGMSPHEYIDRARLFHAGDLLNSSKMSIRDVALNSGFSDVKYFIGWFKKKRGITPGEFRRKNTSGI